MAWDEANDGPFYGVEAPTVAAQQCGQINEKALEAAYHATALKFPGTWLGQMCITFLRAYLEAVTPPDVAKIADAIEACDWSNVSIGNKAILRKASTALRLSAGGGVPEGWKLVPVEPTPEMIGAFWRQKNCGTQGVGERGPHTDDCSAYRAMLAASPTVEAGHVE